MALRGDVGRVQDLTGKTTVDAVLPWMEAANAVVTARLSDAELADATLTMIEEHLAAHYVEMGAVGAKKSERLADWSASYETANLSDLRASRNGRIAIELDTSGTLAEASKLKPAFRVL